MARQGISRVEGVSSEKAVIHEGGSTVRLENKVVLISGGARGMGAAEAKLFAGEGAKVVIGDVLEEEGRRTEAEIGESGGECLFVRLDVSSESDWIKAVAATVERFGKLDVLVNNAGIYRTERVEETSGECGTR
jgi:3alpha(or 20beta)-hydroxysteroid dehydrogenase|tara:strand:+ start:111 stop:512 length:402 start_codon:yes stop_codon:yes gene_type:complete